jgi:hypothetical protein
MSSHQSCIHEHAAVSRTPACDPDTAACRRRQRAGCPIRASAQRSLVRRGACGWGRCLWAYWARCPQTSGLCARRPRRRVQLTLSRSLGQTLTGPKHGVARSQSERSEQLQRADAILLRGAARRSAHSFTVRCDVYVAYDGHGTERIRRIERGRRRHRYPGRNRSWPRGIAWPASKSATRPGAHSVPASVRRRRAWRWDGSSNVT